MSETIGFIGLGKLGLPMATNLLDSGYLLRVYNRTADKAQPLVDRGATRATRAVDAVTPGGIVVTVLWDAASVESVVAADGFLERLGPGGIHVAMSTILPEAARRLAELHAEHGCTYVEAPVFGRPEAAAARKLWIPFAAPQAAKERVRPVLEAMGGQGIFDFGETAGAATVVKIAGNFLIISAVRSLAEAVAMAEKNGVDAKAIVDMLTTTLFTAPVYQSYGKMLVERTATMATSDIVTKDIALFRSTAEHVDLPTPIADRLSELVTGR